MTDTTANKPSIIRTLTSQVIIIAVIMGAVHYLITSGTYAKYLLPQPQVQDTDNNNKQAEAVGNIEQSVSSISTTIGDLTQRLNDLEKENADLKEEAEKQQKTAATTADIEEVKTSIIQTTNRIGQVEAKVSSGMTNPGDRHFAMLSALWALQYRLNFGLPFATDLKALKSFSKEIPEIAEDLKSIEPFANTGIKTISDLVDDFTSTSENVQKVAETYVPDKSWWQGFIINISHIGSIRKVGAENNSADEVLRRTRRSLNHGDLSPAVAEVQKLPEAYAKSTEEWLKDANARLAADDAVSSVYERILDSYEKTQGQRK